MSDPSAAVTAPTASNENQPPEGNTSARKQMTKAERRELQERQRAEKAAKLATGKQATPGTQPSAAAAKPPTSQRPAHAPNTSTATSVSAQQSKRQNQGQKQGQDAVLDVETQRRHHSRIFAHFVPPKNSSSGLGLGAGIKGEIHPAIVRLGTQFSGMKLVGSNARCIAMLTAFKTVIQDYMTPANTTLSRDLTTYLSPQISYLVAARPMAVTMGNAIRALKYEISILSIDLPEQNAKDYLCQQIDTYISHRIILADSVIEDHALDKIRDGDVLMTFARSSVVEQTLLNAWRRGKRFHVVVVDSRPLLEGKRLLASLTDIGIPCTYMLSSAIGSIMTEISMVFIGAHALNSNGSVYSRAGTAVVAMLAKAHSVPVLVLSETYKYSNTLQLDSFTKNELAPVIDPSLSFPKLIPKDMLVLGTEAETDLANLQVITPLYDLTPHTHITVLVTEVGLIPPSAISTLSGGREKDKEKTRLQMAL